MTYFEYYTNLAKEVSLMEEIAARKVLGMILIEMLELLNDQTDFTSQVDHTKVQHEQYQFYLLN